MWRRFLAPLLVLLPLFALYAATACRTVGPGDSGELTVVMTTWGVAHAPGYPLLSLVGNLVSLLPFPGEPAFLLNLLSALFAALAAAVLAQAVIETTGSSGAGIMAGLALGTSRVFWEYALVVEVFALNSLFGALLLYLLARFVRGFRENRPVYWPLPATAAVASTAITHHLTLVLVAVPVLVTLLFVLVTQKRPKIEPVRLRRAVLVSIAAGLAGLLPLLYIPLAARGNPVLNWDDPTTTGNFIRLLKREDFGSGTLMSPWAVATTLLDKGEAASPTGGRHVFLYWAELPRNFGWIFLLFVPLGAVYAAVRRRYLLLFVAAFLGMMLVFFLRVNSPVLPLYMGVTERFYILPNGVIAFLGGLGAAFAASFLERRGRTLAPLFFGLAALATSGVAAMTHGPHVSMKDNTFTRDFGANFLEGIPENAIVLSEGDLFHNAFYYQQACLGKRPDLELVDQQKLTYFWYVNQVRRRNRFLLPEGMTAYSSDPRTHVVAWLDRNLKGSGRPVVAVGVRDQSWFKDYRLVPMGLWWRFWPKEEVPSVPAQATTFEAIVNGWELRSLERHYHDRSWETAERPLYTRALALLSGTIELAHDVATGTAVPEIVSGGRAAGWLDRAVRMSHDGGEAAVAARLEVYHRALAEQTVDFAPFGGAGPLITKTLAMAEEAVSADPDNLEALKTLASLLRADSRTYDPLRELEIRGRIVDLAPGNVTEMAAYVQLAIDLMNDPARRGQVRKVDLVRRQKALLARLDLAVQISDDPSLREQRNQWGDYLRKSEALPQ